LATAISLKLNMAMRELERIKKKVEYVISCNGDFNKKKKKIYA